MKTQAEKVIQTLEDNGFEAFFIGGSVRNTLHNMAYGEKIPIKDYDIVTNATCEQVMELFKNTEARGVQFQVAVVKMDGYEFEVAQYRGEIYPEGGSLRPDKVYAVKTLEEDLKRRDFTINAIAMKKDGTIVDPNGFVKDIRNRLIRAVGSPDERFAEDPLRIMRAFRFHAQLGYAFDGRTGSGMINNFDKLKKVPHERMKEEFHKLLRAEHVVYGFASMRGKKLYRQTFLNSITGEQVYLLKGSLDLPRQYFHKMLQRLEMYDRKNADISELYYILYYYTNYKITERELKNMMFLNEKEVERTVLLLKNSDIVYLQTSIGLYNLVKDIGEQRGMSYLQEILESYKHLHDVSFDKLEELMDRPLFKSQLPFNGNDVMETGKKYNLKPGKWIGEILDEAQKNSIFGVEYTLEDLIQEKVSSLN